MPLVQDAVPLEIVSKVILRHVNLSTNQRYLGTVSDVEAMRWSTTSMVSEGGKGVKNRESHPLSEGKVDNIEFKPKLFGS